MGRVDSLEKTLMLGGIGGRRRRGRQRMRWLDGGWHHWLDGHESQWTLGVGDGQGDLVCCDSWGHKELDTTKRLNWTELNWTDASALRSGLSSQGTGTHARARTHTHTHTLTHTHMMFLVCITIMKWSPRSTIVRSWMVSTSSLSDQIIILQKNV